MLGGNCSPCCQGTWYCYGCPDICDTCSALPSSMTANFDLTFNTCKTSGSDTTVRLVGSTTVSSASGAYNPAGFFYPAITCSAYGTLGACGTFGRSRPAIVRITMAIVSVGGKYLIRAYVYATISVDPSGSNAACGGGYYANNCFPGTHVLSFESWYKEVDATSYFASTSSGTAPCMASFPVISGDGDMSTVAASVWTSRAGNQGTLTFSV